MPAIWTPLELVHLQLEGLFVHDPAGRMLHTNEWTRREAPLMALSRSVEGNRWRLHAGLPTDVGAELDALCAAEPVLTDPRDEPFHRAGFLSVLEQFRAVDRVIAGPAYLAVERRPLDGGVELVTATNARLLEELLVDWMLDVPHVQPCYAAMHEGRAVSVCASVRITPTTHEAGVETAPMFRGLGHASRAVSAWAHSVRRAGAMPIYSTSWDNTASQAIAAKLNFELFGTNFSVY